MAQTHPHPLFGYFERWLALKQVSDSKDDLIEELFTGWNQEATKLAEENEALRKRLQNSQLDLQTQVAAMTCQLDRSAQDNEGLKNRNPYVTVLIDGDGLLFQEHWITQGIEGGKKAAYALRAAIAEFCEDHDDVEVIAKAYANIKGLSRAMQREGPVQDGHLIDFALGFTQAKASFDFIDVGYGKERADSKIKEITRWHLRNHNCKHVFLGISHDSGYAPFLDEVLQDESTRKRVTILEGCPTATELRATRVHIYADPSGTMFRRDKIAPFIPNGHGNGHHTGKARQEASPPPPSSESDNTPTPPTLCNTGSWATVTRTARSPPKKTTSLAYHQPAPVKANKQPAKWIPGPRGLDPPVTATIEALRLIKKREKGEKYCNNFYLRGSCPTKGSGCQFIHDAKLSAHELAAIKQLARSTPCIDGQDCHIKDCIFGHHCPSTRDGRCTHPYCKFSEAQHPPDTLRRQWLQNKPQGSLDVVKRCDRIGLVVEV